MGWPVVLLLAAVTFVTHFLLLTQFGLYEDDYFYTLSVFGWDWPTWWAQVQDAILHPIQGRPLNHAVRRTLFFLSLNHGGLQSAYLVSWALVTVNAMLMFCFVRRILSPRAALAAALLFIVYPIDTSRQMLMHMSDLHLGALILLVALNLYACNRPWSAFGVAALGLVNYESFYLPFLAAPFLLASKENDRWPRLVRHGLLFFGIAGGVLLARKLLGESRASEMIGGLGDVVGRMLSAGPIGAWQSLKALSLRPLDALLHAAPYAWMLGFGISLLAWWWLTRTPANESPDRDQPSNASLGWIAGGAVLAWFISYLLSFREGYYPPIVSIGRLTGVHTPGTFGAAMLAGVLAEFAGRLHPHHLRTALAVVFAGLIGFSAAFGIEVQRSEYAAHWTKQVAFYRSMVELVEDLREGELIVLDAEGDASVLPITQGFPRFGTVNYTPLAIAKYFTWPEAWRTVPQIAVLWNECPVQPVAQGLALFSPPWRYKPAASPNDLPKDIPVARDGQFIYLTAQNGRLRRLSGPVSIRGHVLTARAQAVDVIPTLDTSPLFKQLTGSFDPQFWFTLRNARNYPQ